jgi:predicted  nucleic acid-binding Zn-ribbon protein
MDKPTCARGVEVLAEITKKIKDLGDENDRCMARIKDLENEIDSCMERVKHLQKGNDKHMEIVKCLEKENDIYRAREKFFMYALLLSGFTMLLVVCVALIK